MTAPDAPKLSLHDQLLINLCGWLAVLVHLPDQNLDPVLAQLADTLPQVTRSNPLIADLYLAASVALRAGQNRLDDNFAWCTARMRLADAVGKVFFTRAALVLDALAPRTELADAAE
jgi:hypothetical protein